jgi:hypothetical protein
MSSLVVREVYKYDELPQDDTIRYLTLYPGSGNDPLRCSLHTAPMSETEFEALSYVWGSDVRDREIICDGMTLALTTNLFHVLQRVRQPETSRHIWADLICINQENLDEKGHQVAIMGQIYRHASRVLIHLGDNDENHGPRVHSLINDICTVIDSIIPMIPEDWDTFPYPNEDDPILIDPRWDSLCLLLDVPWFTRGWVVREAGSGRTGQVYWGTSEFSWELLMRTCNWLYKRAVKTLYAKKLDGRVPLAHVEVYEDRHPRYAKLFTTATTWVDSSTLGYLSITRDLKLKDPRDRIYAFLELVQDEKRQVRLRPNYKDPFLLVYQEFASEFLRLTGNIGLLSVVEHDEQSLISGIPSWVPRWDLPLSRAGYAFAPADAGYPELTSRAGNVSRPTVTGDGALRLDGVLFDSVFYTSKTLNGASTTIDTICEIWTTMESFASVSPYPRRNQLSLFISILTAGTREGDLLTWLRSEAAYYQAVHEGTGGSRDFEVPSQLAEVGVLALFHNTVKGYTHNKRVILTERGYMGLAPAVTQKGDLCGIVFGCTAPCVLRTSSAKNHFKYLGAAYIVGQNHWQTSDGRVIFNEIFGSAKSKDWEDLDVEEQFIFLC